LSKIKAAAQGSNVHVLENESIVIDGTAFLGATLWTDFRLIGDPIFAGMVAAEGMNDFKAIRLSDENYRKFRPKDAAVVHGKSIAWLKTECDRQRTLGHRIAIVTHHAPSARSISACYQSSPMNPAYASNLDEFVVESGATLWVHGHSHQAKQYSIGETLVVSNPRGYPEEDTGFDDSFVLEVN
jgi:predicted phosphodiesterase